MSDTPSNSPGPTPAPDETEELVPFRPRWTLSLTQVIASALAAITATVAASFLGVAGTVIGAAVASVLTVVGNAVYSQSIQRTGARVRTAVPAVTRWAPPIAPTAPAPIAPMAPTPTGPTAGRPAALPAPRAPAPRRRSWRTLTVACVAVFAGVLLLVTTVELVAGRPLTELLRGKSGTGTSLFGTDAQPVAPASPSTVTITAKVVTQTPTVIVTGTPVTQTASPTSTATPTVTPSSPTTTPSGSVSGSTSATPSGSKTP